MLLIILLLHGREERGRVTEAEREREREREEGGGGLACWSARRGKGESMTGRRGKGESMSAKG